MHGSGEPHAYPDQDNAQSWRQPWLSNFANGSKVHPLCSILLHSASPAAMTALATEETSIHYMLVQLLPYAAAAEGSINKAIVALGGSTEEELPQAYQQLLLLASTSQACYTAMHIIACVDSGDGTCCALCSHWSSSCIPCSRRAMLACSQTFRTR